MSLNDVFSSTMNRVQAFSSAQDHPITAFPFLVTNTFHDIFSTYLEDQQVDYLIKLPVHLTLGAITTTTSLLMIPELILHSALLIAKYAMDSFHQAHPKSISHQLKEKILLAPHAFMHQLYFTMSKVLQDPDVSPQSCYPKPYKQLFTRLVVDLLDTTLEGFYYTLSPHLYPLVAKGVHLFLLTANLIASLVVYLEVFVRIALLRLDYALEDDCMQFQQRQIELKLLGGAWRNLESVHRAYQIVIVGSDRSHTTPAIDSSDIDMTNAWSTPTKYKKDAQNLESKTPSSPFF